MAAERPIDERVAILLREAPDSDPLVQRVTIALHRASRELSRSYRQALTETGISYPDYQVLRALALDGPPYTLNPSRIAEACGQTQSTMTARLESLEDRDLICRERDPASRIKVNVVLTDLGHDTWRRAYSRAAKAEQSMLSALDAADLRALDAMLARILAHAASPSEEESARHPTQPDHP